MIRVFEGRTADEAWQKISSAIRTSDGTSPQGSRIGDTREILHAAISISEPRQRWVLSRNPPINLAFAIAEVIWIMAGRTRRVGKWFCKFGTALLISRRRMVNPCPKMSRAIS